MINWKPKGKINWKTRNSLNWKLGKSYKKEKKEKITIGKTKTKLFLLLPLNKRKQSNYFLCIHNLSFIGKKFSIVPTVTKPLLLELPPTHDNDLV